MRIDPGFAYYEWPVKFALHLPLRFEVATTNEQDEIRFESFGFRKEDYDEPADFAKFIRFVTYGRKEERLFFSINSLRPATIGHGMVVNAYQPNIGINQSMTGLLFDAYNDYGGFQFQTNDITFQNQVLGGLAFVKPASLFSDHWFAKGFSVGVEYLADLKAPRCIKSREYGDCLRPNSLEIESSVLNPDTFFNEQGLPYVETTPVQAIGLSVETKVAKLDRTVDLKLYGTHHTFTNQGGGSGSAIGGLARLNFGESWDCGAPNSRRADDVQRRVLAWLFQLDLRGRQVQLPNYLSQPSTLPSRNFNRSSETLIMDSSGRSKIPVTVSGPKRARTL